MTPTDEAHFIALWQQGRTSGEIAQALGVPLGTVSSRAHALQQQGKIQPRPRGGAYPTQRRQAALAGVSFDTPGVSKRVSTDTPRRSARVSTRVSPDTQPLQYLPPNQGEMMPLLTDILQELRQLTSSLAVRVSTDTPGVPTDTPGVSHGVSGRTPLPAARGPSVHWNLHLSARLRERIKAMAAARGLQDSQMVEELLWLALAVAEEDPAGQAGKAETRNTYGRSTVQ
jgi:hypothetical protein